MELAIASGVLLATTAGLLEAVLGVLVEEATVEVAFTGAVGAVLVAILGLDVEFAGSDETAEFVVLVEVVPLLVALLGPIDSMTVSSGIIAPESESVA